MYPGPARPAFGVFVRDLADAVAARGHTVDRAVLDDPGAGALVTPAKYATLLARATRLAARRPDVVWAHFLFPPGAIARLAAARARAPYVVVAHGRDVANARGSSAMSALTRWSLARAAAVVAVSEYLRDLLPEAAGRPVEVIDSGVDTDRFTPAPRAAEGPPRYLFVGSLTARKNVARLLDAFRSLDAGTLTVIGTGPLERALRAGAPAGVTFLGAVGHDRVRDELRRADVLCQPSLVEPLGQAVLEALASGRPVVATRVGGPAEYVDDRCGVLVDPHSVESIADGMRRAAALPVPCEAGVAVAAAHSLRAQAERVERVLADAVAAHAGAARPDREP
jgi:glycosyltransferase involved in cell wall biosynthesis